MDFLYDIEQKVKMTLQDDIPAGDMANKSLLVDRKQELSQSVLAHPETTG